jgi:tRNA(Arg) A34 adenosine deaminase TadA
MEDALAEARKAATKGEVPVGAVLVENGVVIARAHNATEAGDPTAHAEMLLLRATGRARLPECELYVTLEPCAMCAAALSHGRIRRLIFGAYDVKGGAVEHGPRFYQQPTCHHAPEVVGGVMEAECGQILKDFFTERRG